MSGTPALASGSAPVPASKVFEWANTYQEVSKKAESSDLSCYVRSFEAKETAPFEVSAKRGFFGKIFFRIKQTVKSFFGFYSYNLDAQLKRFVEAAKGLREEDLQGYLGGNKEKKVDDVFSSVRDLLGYLEQRGEQTKVFQDLVEAEQKLGHIFAQHILSDQAKLLEKVTIGISDKGEVSLILSDGKKYSKEDLFDKLQITDELLQEEFWKEVGAKVCTDDKAQGVIKQRFAQLYHKACSGAASKVEEITKKYPSGRLSSAEVTKDGIKECLGTISDLEKGYNSFLKQVGEFFAAGSGFIKKETLEAITTAVNKEYQATWNKLGTNKNPVIRFSLLHFSLDRLTDFVSGMESGLKSAEAIFEDQAKGIIAYLDTLQQHAQKIQESLAKETGEEGKAIAKKSSDLLERCKTLAEQVSKAKKVTKGEIEMPPVVARALNTGEIIDKPYVHVALNVAQAFQKRTSYNVGPVLEGVLRSVGPVALGFALSGNVDLSLYSLAVAAGGLILEPLVEKVGKKLGLSEGMAMALGVLSSLVFTTGFLRYGSLFFCARVVPTTAPVATKVVEAISEGGGTLRETLKKVLDWFAQAPKHPRVVQGHTAAWDAGTKLYFLFYPKQVAGIIEHIRGNVVQIVFGIVGVYTTAKGLYKTLKGTRKKKEEEGVS